LPVWFGFGSLSTGRVASSPGASPYRASLPGPGARRCSRPSQLKGHSARHRREVERSSVEGLNREGKPCGLVSCSQTQTQAIGVEPRCRLGEFPRAICSQRRDSPFRRTIDRGRSIILQMMPMISWDETIGTTGSNIVSQMRTAMNRLNINGNR
jgi:hypothetical protein